MDALTEFLRWIAAEFGAIGILAGYLIWQNEKNNARLATAVEALEKAVNELHQLIVNKL
ncbi:MAG: hypothetical protein AAF571_13230 [Verrucomicrobiota bacterium]